MGPRLAGLPIRWSLLALAIGRWVPQLLCKLKLSPESQLGCLPYPTSTARVNTVLPLKIVSVETGVPGGKPLQGMIGYLAYTLSPWAYLVQPYRFAHFVVAYFFVATMKHADVFSIEWRKNACLLCQWSETRAQSDSSIVRATSHWVLLYKCTFDVVAGMQEIEGTSTNYLNTLV